MTLFFPGWLCHFKGLFIPVLRKIHHSKIPPVTSWQLTNERVIDIWCQSWHQHLPIIFVLHEFILFNSIQANKSTSRLTQSLHNLIDTHFAHFSSLTFSLLAFKNFWEVELWQSCSWIQQTDTYLAKTAFSKHLNKIEIWQSKLLLPSSHSRWCLQVIRCYWKWFKVVFLSSIIFYVSSIILNWGL